MAAKQVQNQDKAEEQREQIALLMSQNRVGGPRHTADAHQAAIQCDQESPAADQPLESDRADYYPEYRRIGKKGCFMTFITADGVYLESNWL